MEKPIFAGKEDIKFEGKTFQIISQPWNFDGRIKNLERARRSPGVRLIIVKDNKLLLTKEYRMELNRYDYRLPGGKVFDSLEEYKEALESGKDMLEYAIDAAKKECIEETGIVAKKIKHFQTTQAGQTIVWDLYYFIVEDFEENKEGQSPEFDEEIYPEWKTFEEINELCIKNEISEDRSLGVLFRFFILNNMLKL